MDEIEMADTLRRWLADCGGDLALAKATMRDVLTFCRATPIFVGADYAPAVTRAEIAAQ